MALLEILSIEFLFVVVSAILSVIGYYFHVLRRLIRFIKKHLGLQQQKNSQD